MTRKIKKWILCAGVAMMTTSCIMEEFDINPIEPIGEPGIVRFTLAVPGHSAPRPATRALTETQENAIGNVDVLAFYTSGDDTGELAYHKVGKVDLDNTSVFEIELPEGTYDLMVIGNAASAVQGAGLIPRTTTKAQAIAALKVIKTGQWDTSTIPIWGYRDNVEVDEDVSLTGDDAIDMHRMLVRIDVTLSGTAAGTDNANFALTEVYLANYNTIGQIAPNYTNSTYWDTDGGVVNEGSGIALLPSVPSVPGKQTGMATTSPWGPSQVYTDSGTADDTDGFTKSAVTRTIYTFEAENGDANSRGTNPCLVIGGKYDESSTTTYYRVDFLKNTGSSESPVYTYLDLLRNHCYTIAISKVSGPGFDTPYEAFTAVAFNIEAGVIEWEDGGMGNIVFDGVNYMSVDPGTFAFDKPAATDVLTINTDVSAGWTATVSGSKNAVTAVPGNWLSVDVTNGPGNKTNQSITLSATENGDSPRTAYIHIKAGRLTYIVTVTQSTHTPMLVVITDLNDNPITSLNFNHDGTPKAAGLDAFKVKWFPADRPLTISRIRTGVDVFTWSGTGGNLTTLPAGGNYTFSDIQPEAIPSTESFFYNRASSLIFMVFDTTGENSASNSISLFQGNKIDNVTGTLSAINNVTTESMGKSHNISFTSQATGTISGTNVSGPVAWKAEFSENNGDYSPTPPEWLVDFPTSGDGDLATTSYTVLPSSVFSRSSDGDFSGAAPRGTADAPWNLASPSGGATWETANSYIVNNPGWYSLPLAYGNAIQGGAEVNTPYLASGTATVNFTKNFIRHDGLGINRSYIYNNTGFTDGGPADATLVWQDVPGMLTDIKLDDAKQNLLFHIDENIIRQGNAVVAVRDAKGAIMWSWHIWVTKSSIVDAANPAAATKPTKTHTIYGENANYILEYPLGYVESNITNYNARSVIVRISQVGVENPATRTFTISHSANAITYGNVCTYYQWGRKDAMIPSLGLSNNGTQSRWVEWGIRKDGKPYNTIGDLEAAATIQNSQPTATPNTGNIIKAIVNPHVFYPAASSNDWNMGTITSESNKTYVRNLWSLENTDTGVSGNAIIKTVYDPSPVGLKMLPNNAFTGFTESGSTTNTSTEYNIPQPTSNYPYNKGWTFYLDGWQETDGATSYYQAFGSRSNATGAFSAVNNFGYYWTGTPVGSSGGYLYMSGGGLYPSQGAYRSNGFAVRPGTYE